MLKVLSDLKTIAKSERSVLLIGPTGAGKDVLAEYVHRHSNRSACPLEPLDCGALVGTLLQSELFGHARGAFTGALSDRKGALERAAGGVLFLDEIANLGPEAQAIFLRVLDDRGDFRPVGSNRKLVTDFKLVSATNSDPEALIDAGRFREDLFYRLSGFVVRIPALRERRDDIAPLALHYIHQSLAQHHTEGLPDRNLGSASRDLLESYIWPGNVRQLVTICDRAVSFAIARGENFPDHEDFKKAFLLGIHRELPEAFLKHFSRTELVRTGLLNKVSGTSRVQFPPYLTREEFQSMRHDAILRVIEEEGTLSAACNRLGINPSTVHRWLKSGKLKSLEVRAYAPRISTEPAISGAPTITSGEDDDVTARTRRPIQLESFLEVLPKVGRVGLACEIVGIEIDQVQRWVAAGKLRREEVCQVDSNFG
ncbi:MAG: sigma 54-interacting transcriptional regulator [Oligoflexia bacterium]|nr:sigma 54-interacting transcriptional regulator [Oligoflexia bacterium]